MISVEFKLLVKNITTYLLLIIYYKILFRIPLGRNFCEKVATNETTTLVKASVRNLHLMVLCNKKTKTFKITFLEQYNNLMRTVDGELIPDLL